MQAIKKSHIIHGMDISDGDGIPPWTSSEIEKETETLGRQVAYVAAGQFSLPVAYAIFHKNYGHTSWITMLAVDANHRKMGLGRLAFELVVQDARNARTVSSVKMKVPIAMLTAQKFCRALGMKAIKHGESNTYDDRGFYVFSKDV